MAAVTASGPAAVRGRAGLGGVIRSELTKLKSVRSTWWTLLVLVLLSIGFSALICAVIKANWHTMSASDKATFDATSTSLGGIGFLGPLVIAVLGALVITSEYSTGMIRTSLTVMPRRSVMFAAKGVVFGLVTLVLALVLSFLSFFIGQALLGDHSATLSHQGTMRAIVGTAIYVTLCGLLAYGIGVILRHTAGTITLVVGILFVLPIIINLFPSSWHNAIVRWLPTSAGDAISTTVGTNDHMFSAWGEMAVLGVYVVIVLIAGATLFRTRDA
ncbi:MAG TPA: ABC transporter permease subunit [Streptosporangiaceae bacterium]|jgi:ABC-type transport system involved in multi-copper enzyme maturation permease subunit